MVFFWSFILKRTKTFFILFYFNIILLGFFKVFFGGRFGLGVESDLFPIDPDAGLKLILVIGLNGERSLFFANEAIIGGFLFSNGKAGCSNFLGFWVVGIGGGLPLFNPSLDPGLLNDSIFVYNLLIYLKITWWS